MIFFYKAYLTTFYNLSSYKYRINYYFNINMNTKNGILFWISSLTVMVLLMIIIGGLTRLTDSGLSIVDWKPLMGTIPPLSHHTWIELFNNYKSSPEFKIVNSKINLEEFKAIFWWEWFHRFFARLIGLVFIFPFIYFIWKKKLSKNLSITMMIVLIFGFFQAIVGWWMVKSGLIDNPYVSAYRLAFHLANALIIFSILFWLSLSLYYGKERIHYRTKLVKNIFHISIILVFITIISGSFMAGNDAGKSFNTFPLMNEQLIPEGYYINEYGWKNIFENTIAINFNHRWLAIFTFLFISSIIIYLLSYKKKEYNNFSLVLVQITLFLQFFLGIITLVYEVPLSYAILHQTNAVLLLASMLFAYYKLIYK